jgi:hypothetical protein
MATKLTIKLPPTQTTKFPALALPDPAITAPVKVRLGDTLVSAVFPARK